MRRKPETASPPQLVLDLPTELNAILARHREIPWARVAEQALWHYARRVQLADRLASRSALTERAALSIGRAVKQGLRRRYRKTAAR